MFRSKTNCYDFEILKETVLFWRNMSNLQGFENSEYMQMNFDLQVVNVYHKVLLKANDCHKNYKFIFFFLVNFLSRSCSNF